METQYTDEQLTDRQAIVRRHIEGIKNLEMKVSNSVSESLRLVLGGRDITEISSTLKTTIGVVLEGVLLDRLALPHMFSGPDSIVEGIPLDIKHTVRDRWMFGDEYFGVVCMVIRSDVKNGVFSMGLITPREHYMSEGRNRDTKRTLNAMGREAIEWIFEDKPIRELPVEIEKTRLDRIEESIARLTDRVEEVLIGTPKTF